MIEMFYSLAHRRHFWRHVTFSEMRELYISLMMRTVGLSMIGIFVPVYLYELGYSIATIALFYSFVYGTKIFMEPIFGYVIKRQGSKRSLEISYALLIIDLLLVLSLSYYAVPLVILAIVQSVAATSFYTSFDVQYSSIKSLNHTGRQIGNITIIRKLGGALGPLIGGLIASFISIQLTIVLAMLIIALAAIPLSMTPETLNHRHLTSVTVDHYVRYKRYLWPYFGIGMVIAGVLVTWPLFIVTTILVSNVYAALGLIVTVSLLISIVSAHFFGEVIDTKKGKSLLNYSAGGLFLSFLIRPFVTSFGGALGINAASEPLMSGADMPFEKGYFDGADSQGKDRMAFIVVVKGYADFIRSVFFLLVWFAAVNVGDLMALEISFIFCAIGALLMTTQPLKAKRYSDA